MSYKREWSRSWLRWYLFGLALLSCSVPTQALITSYCSPDNVASTDATFSNYMSNGLCQTTCQGSYVFAVILGKNCWCTNDAPSNQEDTSLCSDACPGFPNELCGNSDLGLYAYFNLGGSPSGTVGGSSPTSPRATSTIRSSSVESSSSLLSSSTGVTNDPSQVYTSIISVTGMVSTIVVTPTPAQTTDSALGANGQANSSGGGGGGLKGGTVAGIVVGVAVAIGLAIGVVVFVLLRKRHRKDLDAMSEGASFTSPSHASKSNGGIPSRQVSQMSSAGLLIRPSRVNTGGPSSGGDDHRSGQAATINSDRASTHMTVDQRLNPWAIYSNEDSRASNVSLQDNQDYSRQLRVANPDP